MTEDSAWARTKTGELQSPPPDQGPAHLVVVYSPKRETIGRRWPLRDEPLVFGRARTVTARVSDQQMSKQHAAVELGRDGLYVRDLGSRNGTFVDGRRVGQTPVPLGQVLAMGSSLLVVDLPHRHAGAFDDGDDNEPGMIAASETMRGVRHQLIRAAQGSGGILLIGPTGVGKEVAAEIVVRHSPRRGPYRKVNCAAFQPSVADSELFGHVKGAFTGADRASEGLFQASDGGILFLDELGELGPGVQAKLLRAAESGEIRKVGATASTKVDVRLVTATNRRVDTGDFRGDLYARLCTWVIEMPALSERRADILPLFEYFYQAEVGAKPKMGAAFAEALLLGAWPHNARGLRNLARRVAGDPEAVLTERNLPEDLRASLEASRSFQSASSQRPAHRPDERRQQIHGALLSANGNVSRAAEQLGIDRAKLYREARKYSIDVEGYRGGTKGS